MIKYIGSKRELLPWITAALSALPAGSRVLDLFSGTSRVGHALKAAGLHVTANDHNRYAWHLAGCYVATDADRLTGRAEALLAELRQAPPVDGWFTDTYCRRSRYIQPDNGARIEGMRRHLDALLPPDSQGDALLLRHVLLTSLMEAADRVDSTVGVQMAWLKKWSRRSHKPVALRLPAILPGPGAAWCEDAVTAAAAFSGDAAYLDPPYNQHSYLGNYHLWETLCRYDAPDVYGVACKRVDCRTRKSDFNSKRRIRDALAATLDALDVPTVVLSFSDEGYLARDELEAMLQARGTVAVVERGHRRYIGSQIGVYSPSGDKVGEAGARRNTERMYIAGTDAGQVEEMAGRAASVAST